MGATSICEHGFYLDGCRCPTLHMVKVRPCDTDHEHHVRDPHGVVYDQHGRHRLRSQDLLNPEVLPQS